MKRYILDEVATFEEATINPCFKDSKYRYAAWKDSGEIDTCTQRSQGVVTWLKLTVLEGSPIQIAKQLIDIGNNTLNELLDEANETEADERLEEGDSFRTLGLSEADF